MFHRRAFMLSGLALMAGAPALARTPEVFAAEGVAINGYDPVAYFTERAPVKGSAEFAATLNGATWYFASRYNLEQFQDSPSTYRPQFGGYCAYAVARNYTAKTEPDAWSIVNGRLYLNFNRRVRRLWARDIPGNIARGNANWPGVLSL
ncbi:MAG: YHS domain-containing (seleno)protein [Pseudomonadota bacterium]